MGDRLVLEDLNKTDISQGAFLIIRPGRVIEVGGTVSPVPANLVTWLQARSDLALATPSAVTAGGLSGTLLDGTVRPGAQTNSGNAINIACSAADVACSSEDPAGLGFEADNHFQLVVVSVRGQTLLIDMTASSTAWRTARPQLASFLAGLVFPAGG